jgi:AAA domain
MSLVIRTSGWEDYLDPAGGSWLKTLIIGAPDVGKTRSAAFYPKPIFMDCEDGRMSLADLAVPYARVRSTADANALIDQLKFDQGRPPEKRKYLTLVVDSIDHYQKIAISERLRTERKEALAGWQDWGWLDGHMQQFVEKVLNLQMNIVVNCHFKTITEGGDDDVKKVVQQLRLKGDVSNWLLEEFDLIGMMEVTYKAEKGERVRQRHIRWHNEPAYPLLKDRSGSLPQFTEVDFTTDDYTRIWDCLMSKVDDLPASTDVETIEVPEDTVTAAPPDVAGGPVDPGTLPQKRATKAAAKAPAKKTSKKTTKKATTPVDTQQASATKTPPLTSSDSADTPTEAVSEAEAASSKAQHEAAAALIKTELGAEEVPMGTPERVCGKQPDSHKKFPAVPGCGADLDNENVARVNLSLLRAKTMLCQTCFDAWKTAQSA